MKRHHSIAVAALLLCLQVAASAAADGSAQWHMIHSLRQSRGPGTDSIGLFTPGGPELATMQPAPRRVDYIAHDPQSGTYFAQQTSRIGRVDEKGKFLEVEMPPEVDLSHPGGLAFDANQRSLIVASRDGGGTVLFEYFVDENRWHEIANIGREDLHGLAVDPASGLCYALQRPVHATSCGVLRVYNRKGAAIQSINLSEPIPMYSGLRTKLQLVFADSELYAMTSHEQHPRVVNRIHRIDPASGRTTGTAFNASADVSATTWPEWRGGPPPSKSTHTGPKDGTGFDSNYQTPKKLVARQSAELHVIAVQSGGVQYMEWLKKIKKVDVSMKNDTLTLGVELDSEEHAPPVVEVHVKRSKKPVTLSLISAMKVLWLIKPEPGAQIDKVYCFGSPWDKSQVIGVADALVVDGGGDAPAAYAWELDKASSAVDFDEMITAIRDVTGLRENSFQGRHAGSQFVVPFSP